MPKVKTKKAAVKRFKITKTGKILRRGQMMSHLKLKKRQWRIYRQKKTAHVAKADEKRIKRLIPYR